MGTLACTDRSNRLTLFRGDGRRRRTLKLHGGHPFFSPNGRLIAFYSRNKLRVTDRSGRHTHTIVGPGKDKNGDFLELNFACWSGDSTRLAYVHGVDTAPAGVGSPLRLFIADAGGGEHVVPLSATPEEEARRWSLDRVAAFSPDGQTVAFAAITLPDYQRGIWLVDASTGTLRELYALPPRLPETAGVLSLSWSPDGSRLAVVDFRRGFFVVDTAGHATPGNFLLDEPRWSPDGRHIAGGINDSRVANWDALTEGRR